MTDKVKKLRLASKICWILGALCTANFVRVVLAESIEDTVIATVAAIVISLAVQYVLTLIESALFDGSLPAPWNLDWKAGGPLPWLVTGAMLCLLLDVLLNVGGVGYFMSNLHLAGTGPLKISSYLLGIIEVIATVAFAVLLAVGSELLDEFANYIGTNGTRRPQEHRHQRKQQHQHQSETRDEEHIRQAEQAAARLPEAVKKAIVQR